MSDDKIVAAIRGGNAPDVVHSDSSDNTGAFCATGAWANLNDYLQRDNISPSILPPAPRYFTQYKGNRCALPMLADVYGLYYNKALFRQAGISGPPKTMSELAADAKKLTQKNSDGSLKVVGLDPVDGFYENAAAHWGPMFGTQWVDSSGKSILSQ
ncbi:MAG: extracellular solute-binding protein, partial [Actinobacteria bacterium]